jgi:hypothetical protein
VRALRRVLVKPAAPGVEPSLHCFDPYDCEFWDHCTAAKPPDWVVGAAHTSEPAQLLVVPEQLLPNHVARGVGRVIEGRTIRERTLVRVQTDQGATSIIVSLRPPFSAELMAHSPSR